MTPKEAQSQRCYRNPDCDFTAPAVSIGVLFRPQSRCGQGRAAEEGDVPSAVLVGLAEK